MKGKELFLAIVLALLAAAFVSPAFAQVSGQYLEARTADVYTGPCFANSEVNLTGQEAVLAWRIDQGSWNRVALDGFAVVAVVRASSTLGDPYSNPLPARAVLIVDERANEAQQAELTNCARAQAGVLQTVVVAEEAPPIRLQVNGGGRPASPPLEEGPWAPTPTGPIKDGALLCQNEEFSSPPLTANLNHSMPAVS